MWEPKDLSQAFATEGFEIVPSSQIRVIVEMNSSKEECYHKCAEYYSENCPNASWEDLAFKIYRSECCTRQHQALEYMMKQSFISSRGKDESTRFRKACMHACRYLSNYNVTVPPLCTLNNSLIQRHNGRARK